MRYYKKVTWCSIVHCMIKSVVWHSTLYNDRCNTMYMWCVMIRGLLRALLCIVYSMVRHYEKCSGVWYDVV